MSENWLHGCNGLTQTRGSDGIRAVRQTITCCFLASKYFAYFLLLCVLYSVKPPAEMTGLWFRTLMNTEVVTESWRWLGSFEGWTARDIVTSSVPFMDIWIQWLRQQHQTQSRSRVRVLLVLVLAWVHKFNSALSRRRNGSTLGQRFSLRLAPTMGFTLLWPLVPCCCCLPAISNTWKIQHRWVH